MHMLHLNRRQLLHRMGTAAAAVALARLPNLAHADEKAANAFTLPDLPYDYDALEPHIDKETMKIHHDKHHKAYVDNLNKAIAGKAELEGKSVEELLVLAQEKKLGAASPVIINNGGGHANHSMFWTIMAPGGKGGSEPAGDLAEAIKSTFGDTDRFKAEVTKAAMGRFGSGWSWLVLDRDGKLKVLSTANQDSPLLKEMKPLLGIDVWEHAYYLKYQNRRADYVKAWWSVVNWKEVSERFAKAKG
jgi:Fe-Mn family superoxide dismutase